MESFDRDFPGHYLRLIEAVRVAIRVPQTSPPDEIRATLSAGGASKIVIGGPPFIERTIKRPAACVALSAPFQSTGLFVLKQEDELLRPFEGTGVDTDWVFEMRVAANRFDYGIIDDILITIDYTALFSDDYFQQVISRTYC